MLTIAVVLAFAGLAFNIVCAHVFLKETRIPVRFRLRLRSMDGISTSETSPA
jgi:hypothetical protein